MDTDSRGFPLDTVHKEYFGRETSRWLGRADSGDKERFHEVFGDLAKVSLRGKPLPDEATLAEEARIRASALKRNSSYAGSTGAPTGWTYTATRASARKPPKAPTAAPTYTINQSVKDFKSGASADSPSVSGSNTSRTKQRPLSAPPMKMASDVRALREATYQRELQKVLAEENKRALEQKISWNRQAYSPPSTAGPLSAPGLMDRTTYYDAFNLHEQYPEEYEAARQAGKAHQIDDVKFSTIGVSKIKDDQKLRSKMMTSTYNTTNDEVFPGGVLASETEKKEGFYQWVQRQRTYYNDLLPKSNKPAMDELLEESSLQQKGEVLGALRQVHATVVPGQFISHSQEEHCEMKPIETPEMRQAAVELARMRNNGASRVYHLTKEELEQTRREIAKDSKALQSEKPTTLGLNWIGYSDVHGPAPQRKQRPLSAPSAAMRNAQSVNRGAAASSSGSSNVNGLRPTTSRPSSARPSSAPRANVEAPRIETGLIVSRIKPTARVQYACPAASNKKATMKPETFCSQVPLKWAGNIQTIESTYTDTFKRHPTEMREPITYQEFTAPAGAVNPHLLKVPLREAYPVPEHFVKQHCWPEGAKGEEMATTYRVTHAGRDEVDVARSMKAAAADTEYAHKALLRSTVPLGKGGVMLDKPKDWKSEMKDEYVPQEGKWLLEDRGRAEAQKAIWEGPTASTGRATLPHPA